METDKSGRDLSDRTKPSWVTARLFRDPTGSGIINGRILRNPLALATYTDLTDEEQARLVRLLTFVARKLASIWSHKERYGALQKELVEQAERAANVDQTTLDLGYSQELFLEFEEFLFQVKSALDHVVKVPSVMFGSNVWTLSTWGDKGEKVERAISRNLPKRFRHHADGIRDIVLKPHRAWVRDLVEARDKVAHYLKGGIAFEHFAVHLDPDGTLRVPMWSSDQSVFEFLDAAWSNVFRLIEDFIHVFLYLRVAPGFVFLCNPSPVSSSVPAWSVHPEATLDRERRAGRVKPYRTP